jgi:hypothetical protein
MGPTPDQIALIRQYEPALYFSGAPGAPGSERFFPSDAKRYLEHAALYLAKTPFATRADWGTPVGFAGQLGAINGEAAIFIGQFNEAASPQYPFLETNAGQEHFLDVSGWASNDTRADLDHLASLYATNQGLKDSQFWYHAEFFDAARLQNLFTELVRSGSAFNFNNLFGSAPGNPPVLTDPALICYYLFYPAHEESLSGCEYAPGQIVDTARDFASFAGEWSCIALLLDRPNAASPYAPKWAGLSNRNVGKTSVNGEEVRATMRLLPWAAMDIYQVTHPRLFVGRGSHGLYLSGETPPPLTFADPSAAFCGGATSLTTGPVGAPSSPLYGITTGFLMTKVIAGSAAGTGLLGALGGMVGAAAGLVWGIAEIADTPRLDGVDPPETPALQSTIDTTGSNGIVIYPKGLPPVGVGPGNGREWQSADNVAIAGRKYFFTVDRATQVLWGDDPNGQGYTGRWGAHVAQDPQTRRSGMAFPTFWQLFFETLVRNDLPAITIVLQTGKTVATWTVPQDWNAKNNTVECIGGGVGGGTSAVGGALPAGGGGAYSKSVNLAWTPGQVINFSVGAAADFPGNAGDTYVNPSAASFPNSGEAAGARGATSSTGGSSANGYATGIGNVQNAGGNGGGSSWGGGGGGGAGGPNGVGANGGSTSLAGTAGSGGGAAGGGTAGGSTADDPGTAGAGSGGSGAGGTGAAAPSGTAGPGANGTDLDGAHGSGGGGGGGAGDGTNTIAATVGADGGQYGGGGGAGGCRADVGGTPGGKGADGIIVIRYVPAR